MELQAFLFCGPSSEYASLYNTISFIRSFKLQNFRMQELVTPFYVKTLKEVYHCKE